MKMRSLENLQTFSDIPSSFGIYTAIGVRVGGGSAKSGADGRGGIDVVTRGKQTNIGFGHRHNSGGKTWDGGGGGGS